MPNPSFHRIVEKRHSLPGELIVGLYGPISIVMLIHIKRGEGIKIKVVLEPSEEGGYSAIIPSLPGCLSEGDTEEEALKNIQEALELYIEPVVGLL